VTSKSCPLTGTLQKLMPTPTQTATPHTTGPLAFIDNKLRDSKDSFKIALLTRQLHINPDKLTVIQRTLTAKSQLTADLSGLLLPRNLVSNILLNL
jgi:hypothetical protein